MSSPRAPKLLKGGLVTLDPSTGATLRVIPLQYNPDSLTRRLEARSATGEGDRSEALRLTGPPVETIQLEAELDATDAMERAAGAHLQDPIAALEDLLYPAYADELRQRTLARQGTLEIAPAEAPLTVFVWSAQRVLPVRITEFSIAEEAFDNQLNPIRAKLTLGMRVLTAHDLGFDHRGTALFDAHHLRHELAARRAPAKLADFLGNRGI